MAVLLLAARVAVPVCSRSHPRSAAAAPPVAAGQPSAPEPKQLKGLATVTSRTLAWCGSSLDTLVPANPFRPPEGSSRRPGGVRQSPGEEEVILSDEVIEGGSGGGDTGSAATRARV